MPGSQISGPYDPSSPNGGRPASHLNAYPFGGRARPFFDLLTPKKVVGSPKVNMCNIVDENTSTVLSTLSGIHSCQFHAIILYNLPKNDCF